MTQTTERSEAGVLPWLAGDRQGDPSATRGRSALSLGRRTTKDESVLTGCVPVTVHIREANSQIGRG